MDKYAMKKLMDYKGLMRNKAMQAFVIAVLLFACGELLAKGFATYEHVMTILSLSSFLGVIALGQAIVIIGGGEGIDLSVGAMVSISTVIGAQIMNGKTENFAIAVFVVLVVGMLIGSFSGLCIAFLKIPPLVMTMAMASVIQGLSLAYSQGQPKGGATDFLKIIGTGRVDSVSNIFIVWVIIIFIAVVFLYMTKYGKILYGVGENNVVAELSGANSRMVRALSYGACGMISALGGIFLLGYTGTAYLDIGSAYVMPSIAAVVVGGVSLAGGSGSYLGVAGGAIILTTLSSLLLTLRLGEGGRQLVYGLVLLVLLFFYARRK